MSARPPQAGGPQPPQYQQQQRPPPQGGAPRPHPQGTANGVPRPATQQSQQQRAQQAGQGARTQAAQPPTQQRTYGAGAPMAPRSSPSPAPPSRSSSSSSLSSEHDGHSARVIEQVDGVPLVAEVYENQRLYPMVGWSSKLLERAPFTSEDGTEPKSMSDFKVPPGWSWQGEWAVEVLDDPSQLQPGQTLTDKDGWVYATDFSRHFRGGPEQTTLRIVRRRRHFRRRIPPAKSAKSTLGGVGAASNSLTVSGCYGSALAHNPMATLTNSNLSVRVAQSSMSMRSHSAPKKKGAGPSLAELYAKQTVEAPPTVPTAAAPAAAASAQPTAGSPTASASASPPAPATSSSPTGSDGSDAASATLALGASPSPASSASFSPSQSPASDGSSAPPVQQDATGNSLGSSAADSPLLRPKYGAFSSMGMSGGLESLSAGFGGFSFGAGATAGASSAAAPAAEERVMVRLWEHQRYYPVIGWSDKMLPTDRGGRKGGWINEAEISTSGSGGSSSASSSSGGKGSGGGACAPKDSFQPGAGWVWSMPAWMLHTDAGSVVGAASGGGGNTDLEGWSYAVEPSRQYHPRKGLEHFVRKRLWQREKCRRISAGSGGGAAQGSGPAKPQRLYTVFFERLELLKKDLRAEEQDDELVSMLSATW